MRRWTVDPRKQVVADLSDRLADDPPRSGWAKWFGGMVVPLVVAVIGVNFRYGVRGIREGWNTITVYNGSDRRADAGERRAQSVELFSIEVAVKPA